MIKVLFVCTGNICRSPTAEGVFRQKVAAAGLAGAIATDSAGLEGYHVGEPPDPRSIATAAGRGYRIGDLRARRVRTADFREFDLILAMDDGHFRSLLRMAPPDRRDRVRRFLSFAPELGQRDVPDPYYGEGPHFEEVLDLVEAGSGGLLAAIRSGRVGASA